MARSRNIKPGFFRNAELVELPFEYRLLFIGLWTLADREGRLLDRPKQIRMDVFPADTVDIDDGLNALMESGFLYRYEAEGIKAIQINNFVKHQNPHCKEQASEIPGLCKHGASTVQEQDEDEESTVQVGLIPDSLIPDSLIPDVAASTDAGEQTEAAQRKTSGISKRASQMPENFVPDETAAAIAGKHGMSVADELSRFRDHHLSKGSVFKDWQAAFRTWLGNSAKWAKPSATAPAMTRDGYVSGACIGLPGRIL